MDPKPPRDPGVRSGEQPVQALPPSEEKNERRGEREEGAEDRHIAMKLWEVVRHERKRRERFQHVERALERERRMMQREPSRKWRLRSFVPGMGGEPAPELRKHRIAVENEIFQPMRRRQGERA